MIQLKPSTLALLAAIVGTLTGYIALELAFPVTIGKERLLDFDVFHLVSTMIAEGNLIDAYAIETFLPRQAEVPGFNDGEMLWSYPPFFSLVVAPLSLLPTVPSYLVFMTATLVFYVRVVRTLAGPAFHTVLVLFLPLAMLIIIAGQNSFLTGGLIGLTCVLAQRRSRWSGVPLGLMAIKPHLALGLGLWSLLDRRWGMAVQSFAVIGLFGALATLAFGTGVWTATLDSMAATAKALHQGRFPLFRMTSLYAFGLSVGWGDTVALSLHVAGVVAAVAGLVLLVRAQLPPRVVMGAGVFVSALISPYNYDYDLAMLAAAACLLTETVAQHASRAERGTIAVAILIVSSYWFVMTTGFDVAVRVGLIAAPDGPVKHASPLGPILFLGGVVLFRVIWRSRETPQAVPSVATAPMKAGLTPT